MITATRHFRAHRDDAPHRTGTDDLDSGRRGLPVVSASRSFVALPFVALALPALPLIALALPALSFPVVRAVISLSLSIPVSVVARRRAGPCRCTWQALALPPRLVDAAFALLFRVG